MPRPASAPTRTDAVVGCGVLAGFLERVRTLPSTAIAIEDGEVVWTYAELDRQARRAAHALTTLGGATPVALAARPGARALAVMLGALRAGRVVAPLEARASSLNVLGAEILVSDDRPATLAPWPGEVIPIDALFEGAVPASDEPRHALPEPPFVLFSSGTSARPKGVVRPSESVAGAASSYREVLDHRPGDRTAWLAPIAFAASLSAAFGTLLAGGTLVALDPRLGLDALVDGLERARVTHLHLVPSLFRRLARAGATRLGHVRAVKLGGETATAGDLALFQRAFAPGAVLFNGLGATETGHVAFARFDHTSTLEGSLLPIGVEGPGVVVAIVDEALAPVDDGAVGRLAVGGTRLASGYWRDPERSAEVFRDHLGPGVPHAARWFVTSDLARRRRDGQLEHLGRADDLVKIRGKAVVLGEIEAALAACDGVGEAVVVAVPHASVAGEAWLAAFVVGGAPSAEAFARWPDHHRPARIVTLDALPRLPSGKVDRQALVQRLARTRARVHADGLVRAMTIAFEQALGVEHIAPDEDFFALGGHSLAAVEVIAEVSRQTGVELPLSALVEAPTPEALAALCRGRDRRRASAPIVLLRAGRDERPPVFLVPGRAAEALALRELALSLAPHRVYGLQHAALRGGPVRLESLVEAAAEFVTAIVALQPRGPYRLIGSSFGGRIAFEIARLLRARGDEVSLLAMLDSYAPGYARWRPSLDLKRTAAAAYGLIAHRARPEVELTPRLYVRALRYWWRRVRVAARLRVGVPVSADRHLVAAAIADVAGRRAAHPEADVHIELFRSALQPPPEHAAPWPALGWEGRARRGVTVHVLPGQHGDYHREPVLSIVAARLRALLEAAA